MTTGAKRELRVLALRGYKALATSDRGQPVSACECTKERKDTDRGSIAALERVECAGGGGGNAGPFTCMAQGGGDNESLADFRTVTSSMLAQRKTPSLFSLLMTVFAGREIVLVVTGGVAPLNAGFGKGLYHGPL